MAVADSEGGRRGALQCLKAAAGPPDIAQAAPRPAPQVPPTVEVKEHDQVVGADGAGLEGRRSRVLRVALRRVSANSAGGCGATRPSTPGLPCAVRSNIAGSRRSRRLRWSLALNKLSGGQQAPQRDCTDTQAARVNQVDGCSRRALLPITVLYRQGRPVPKSNASAQQSALRHL